MGDKGKKDKDKRSKQKQLKHKQKSRKESEDKSQQYQQDESEVSKMTVQKKGTAQTPFLVIQIDKGKWYLTQQRNVKVQIIKYDVHHKRRDIV